MSNYNQFISPSKGKLPLEEVVDEVLVFMHEEKGDYKLVIGTDSKSGRLDKVRNKVDFVSAVVIHRQGKGGRYFWKKTKKEKICCLRDKIYTETLLSLELAQNLVPTLTGKLNGERCCLEIHIDVGEAGPTREMLKELVGMVNGSGFTAKTKPESFGAFVVADKHTH